MYVAIYAQSGKGIGGIPIHLTLEAPKRKQLTLRIA